MLTVPLNDIKLKLGMCHVHWEVTTIVLKSPSCYIFLLKMKMFLMEQSEIQYLALLND